MGVGKEQAQKIARLAAMDLSEEELAALGTHLERILAFVEKLNEIDTRGVEPLTQPHGEISLFRKDEPAASLPVEVALSNTHARQDNQIKVPRVIEQST